MVSHELQGIALQFKISLYGMSADEIATKYGLTLADVFAALTYYYDHRAEIDDSIRADEAFVSELRKQTPSILREKQFTIIIYHFG